MTANLGNVDRLVRILVGLALIVAPLLNTPPIWSSAVLAYAVMAVGLILAATAVFSFCPLYRILGISTCKI
ncbi:YgaP family membrane protein [Litoreibacter roseus]|uniref:Inner membrane protein YgaP-like transmembrane domain-containing protein n=1 Tax=Litoreibacter roseus TaxID=2601869 RepID=A0A6N6JJS4_9RHOB|nr:DUF2892 domain-containing protein [Litoreibacter roseus]GFE65518.1 hypothetical protein KIN_25920 [Litoreibacter roseus]